MSIENLRLPPQDGEPGKTLEDYTLLTADNYSVYLDMLRQSASSASTSSFTVAVSDHLARLVDGVRKQDCNTATLTELGDRSGIAIARYVLNTIGLSTPYTFYMEGAVGVLAQAPINSANHQNEAPELFMILPDMVNTETSGKSVLHPLSGLPISHGLVGATLNNIHGTLDSSSHISVKVDPRAMLAEYTRSEDEDVAQTKADLIARVTKGFSWLSSSGGPNSFNPTYLKTSIFSAGESKQNLPSSPLLRIIEQAVHPCTAITRHDTREPLAL